MVGTEFFCATGGIQYVNRLLWRALEGFGRRVPCRVEVFAFGDPVDAPPPSSYANEKIQWHAAGSSRRSLAAKLARRLRQAQPHLVLFTHVNLLRLLPLVHWLAADARCAVLGHGIEVWEPLPPDIRHPLNRCVSVIAPSSYTRQKLLEVNGVAPERAVVLHHGLAPEWSAGRSVTRGPHRGSNLLAVTRMSLADACKGLDVLIAAMPRILERCPDARLRIAGGGEDRPRLEQIAREKGVAQQVTFLGELDEVALHEEYERSAVFVLPSRKEGFGIVFLEAMWHGLPVVAARAAGALDVVEDEVTGILVPPEAIEQLASAASGLLLLPEERERLGAAGRKRVEERFLFCQFAERWHHWLASVAPEAIYLARHTAAFAAGSNTALGGGQEPAPVHLPADHAGDQGAPVLTRRAS